MRVTRLRGEGFRNLRGLDFSPGEGVNIIYGENVQGKTNLLEALWLFCGAKSFRFGKDSELIEFEKERLRLDLDFVSEGREQSAAIEVSGDGKTAFLNEVKLDRIAELSSIFRVVMFSPDHLELIKQGPVQRRKFIDQALTQVYPKYGEVLCGYERILRQRGVLLSNMRISSQPYTSLDVWDDALVEYGGYLTWMRLRYISKLVRYAVEIYREISGGKERFTANYICGSGKLSAEWDRKEIAKHFAGVLCDSRKDDIRLNRTSKGPHRDDLDIMLNGMSVRQYGSQGQQRSCVLALKFAECRILEEMSGEPPIVLLDDVMSELDESRRRFLLGHLSRNQVFITCCDAEAVSAADEGRVFEMKAGRLAVVDYPLSTVN